MKKEQRQVQNKLETLLSPVMKKEEMQLKRKTSFLDVEFARELIAKKVIAYGKANLSVNNSIFRMESCHGRRDLDD